MTSLVKDFVKGKKNTKKIFTGLSRIIKQKKLLCLFVMLIASCFLWQKASALDKLLYQDRVQVFEGGTLSLRTLISEEFLGTNYSGDYNAANADYQISYSWNNENPSPECAELGSDGTVKALAAGSAKADIEFTYNNTHQTETVTIEVLMPEQADLTYGGSTSLIAAQIYDTGKYMYTSSNKNVTINPDGTVTAQGFEGAKIYVSGDDGVKTEVAQINIAAPVFNGETQARAAGTDAYIPDITGYTPFEDDKPIEWEIANEAAAIVSGSGIAAVAAGETDVTAVITPKNGDAVKISTKLIVTDPVLSETDIVIAEDATKNITLDGINETSTVEWNLKKSENGIAYFKKEGKLYASGEGEDVVTINADGRDIECYVTVTDPYYDGDGIINYKGMTEQIEIEGLDEYRSTVTYKSSKKAVATVDEDGLVEAKKAGNTIITVNADGRKIEIPVEIASVKGYKASKKAISISNTKTHYSQAKRMKKGYYDCSSLVWRIYSQYDVFFGVKSGWAPTAADIAKWCSNNGKVIYNKAVSSEKLLPGDLVFFSYTKNGRYKNISHVEMYTGQDMDVSASSSNNAVIHYEYSQNDSIVMIARPVS